MSIDEIATDALRTTVGLLDALLDGAGAALPGVTADLYARDFRVLGHGAAQAAADLESLGRRQRRLRRAA